MIGWKWVIADRVLRRFGVREVRLKVDGLAHPVACRVCSSDIYEFTHLLGFRQTPFNLSILPRYIIDAGANVGYSALRFQRDFPGATIVAIEPEGRNADQLVKNCMPYPNIAIERAAVWPTDTTLRIKSLDVSQDAYEVEEDTVGGDIAAISIPTLMCRYKLPRISLLKIDIEGSEKWLFSHPSARNWLRFVDTLLVETHDRSTPGCSEAVRCACAGLLTYSGQIGEYEHYSVTT